MTEVKLVIAVRVMDSAISPRAIIVRALEDDPPGVQAMSIKPTANIGLRFKTKQMIKANRGSTAIWAKSPAKRACGRSKTALKFESLSSSPSPNIRIIKTGTTMNSELMKMGVLQH
jgi:hypothetical protein